MTTQMPTTLPDTVAELGYDVDNPRFPYVVGRKPEPTMEVRGRSRRITCMWFRPTNIRLITVESPGSSPVPGLDFPDTS